MSDLREAAKALLDVIALKGISGSVGDCAQALRAALADADRVSEKDAARYRWLRDKSCPPHNFYLSVPIEFADQRYRPHEVDEYIDAAMLAAAEKEPKDG